MRTAPERRVIAGRLRCGSCEESEDGPDEDALHGERQNRNEYHPPESNSIDNQRVQQQEKGNRKEDQCRRDLDSPA
jgi:hypothetical protein